VVAAVTADDGGSCCSQACGRTGRRRDADACRSPGSDLCQVASPVSAVAALWCWLMSWRAWLMSWRAVLVLAGSGRRVRLEAQMSGGGQERGLRSGTVPTAAAVGLGSSLVRSQQQRWRETLATSEGKVVSSCGAVPGVTRPAV